jgi:hypothetical protein
MSDPPPPPMDDESSEQPTGIYWAGQRRVLWLLVLLMVIAIVLAGTSHNTTTGQSNPKVIMDKTGSGINKTPSFTTSGGWEIDWSYDCTNLGQSGSFQISVYESASNARVDIAAIALGAKGSDVAFEDQGGTYYLQVTSECNWHVIVKD